MQQTGSTSSFHHTEKPLHPALLFSTAWLLLFVLYYPAAKAGFVTDFTGWLEQVKNHAFRDYINRTNFKAASLYQFTQLLTYIYYKVFGINVWAWHILFISLHAVNACLLYYFTFDLLTYAGAAKARYMPLCGVFLFCVSPYMSETIVWEPAFHFLTGLLYILLILRCTQVYVKTGKPVYAIASGAIYFLSLFTLEVFYITPWLVLCLGLFYGMCGDKDATSKILRVFFTPMLVLLLLRLGAYYILYGTVVSRINTSDVTSLHFSSFGKPIKYLFHLLAVGRFWPYGIRQRVYDLCDNRLIISLFYVLIAAVFVFVISRFRHMAASGRVVSLLFAYTCICLALLIPVWFSESLLILYDRYVYFTAAFFYIALALAIGMLPYAWLRVGIIIAVTAANLRYAIMASRYWGKSEKIISSLLHNIPDAGGKTTILLNLPESFNGTAMIGAEKNSEFKLMHDLLLPDHLLPNTVYDGMAYNMSTPADGAHVMVINDRMLHVTLNQWGTWWWMEGKGGYSYETADYKLNLTDPGHWYELTLKKPAGNYQLLFQVGDQWKTVDMSRRNVDQD